MAKKKSNRLVDAAKELEVPPKQVSEWLRLQPQEKQEELEELRVAYQAGEVRCSMMALIRLLKQEAGVPHGEAGIRSWLTKSD